MLKSQKMANFEWIIYLKREFLDELTLAAMGENRFQKRNTTEKTSICSI